MGPNVPTFYRNPVHIVRGEGVWLWDADSRKYLDCYNNVPHVGHCHPKVVQAICTQAGTLNTHTRYLHDNVLDYIERLTGKLNHGISQAIMVCTGSEANDLAYRIACAHTGGSGFIVTDNAYHGVTAVSASMTGKPYTLRPVGGSIEGQPQAFADHVARAIRELEDAGHGFSGMILCPVSQMRVSQPLNPAFLTRRWR